MTATRTDPLTEWAASLNGWQRRCRQTDQGEMARTAIEAVREFALAALVGPNDRPSHRVYCPSSDQHWPQTSDNPRYSGAPTENSASLRRQVRAPPRASAIAACLGASYSRFVRIRQLPLALALSLAIGVLLGLAMLAGIPAVVALPANWSAANDLLS